MDKSNHAPRKFSVILPVRNGGHFIKECVSSILAQSNAHFDLLILENKSTDGTSEWLQSIDDSRVTVYPSDQPLSIEDNWGRVRSLSKNEFITLIGHDDIMESGFLENMSRLIDSNPQASLYLSHYDFIDQNGNIISASKPLEGHYSVAAFTKAILNINIEPIGAVIRSVDYDRIGGIPPYPNLLFADYALWIGLASISSVAVEPKKLFSYRIHLSTSKTTPAGTYINAFFDFLHFLQEHAKKNDELNIAIKEAIPGFLRFYCQSLSLRLLKTPVVERHGKSVSSFVAACNHWSQSFSVKLSVSQLTRLATIIDKYAILRSIYLLFRAKNLKKVKSFK